ncbi:30S ribosomal protein S1 [Rubripirellula amarantea]|uniref:30S ribosomal protein S1 n=1 Tax=Rubripirellula amarantea TaxID=2527999 RepID=A0A5C5WIJ0_9BACT|nr:S1 RNA-binding domain-containing protein [Rubripirellula amarantea]TWT50558.1 30S ribosomal protein S1 [Rubripirellula amarantea]
MSNGDTPETNSAESVTAEPAAATTPETPPTVGNEPETQASSEPAAASKPAPLAGAARSGGGPLAARGLGVAKPASPSVSTEQLEKQNSKAGKKPSKPKKAPRPRVIGDAPESAERRAKPALPGKVAVPSMRGGLDDDLQAELDAELAAADVEGMLGGDAGMPDRKEPLSEGQRLFATVLKIHDDSVFVALGGPDEGVVPFEMFTEEPAIGASIEVVVRSFSKADGLFSLGLPGAAVEASDWEDIDEGSVVDAVVTGHNSGGLEVKVGNMKGFIPISQIADYRVEDTSEFVDQKFLCVVTESNERRGNLVLSRRAILDREREEKKKEQLEKLDVGYEGEGVVRSIKDFGAFVDLGGLDGLIHISKLSWDRVKHPSDVLEVGQKVMVRIDKMDKETGKISLSYRDLLENPWDAAEAEFPVGSVHKGAVTRVAPFGAFVRLGTGVEGLVHISELAHHRVSKVDAFVNEGDEVEVKVVSFDRDAQKVGLSIKQAQSIGAPETSKPEEEEDEPQREVAVKASHSGPLKGGNNRESGGEKFGLRW